MIGQFEGVIQQLAALAALMPIVASIGGNTGNQTMALVIRSSGRDPAHGASVLLTFVTDGMGFFLFLGLARVFLV